MKSAQKIAMARNAQIRFLKFSVSALFFGSSPRSMKGMARKITAKIAMVVMVPQMSGFMPKCSLKNTFMPWVQLMGKEGLNPSAPGPCLEP